MMVACLVLWCGMLGPRDPVTVNADRLIAVERAVTAARHEVAHLEAAEQQKALEAVAARLAASSPPRGAEPR